MEAPSPDRPDNPPTRPPAPAPEATDAPTRVEPHSRGTKRGASSERFEVGDWQEG